MSTYRGYEGMWATFDYNVGPYLLATYKDLTDASLACSRQGFGKVVFLRQNMTFQDSIAWYLGDDDRGTEWSKLRMAVNNGFLIAKENVATVDQTLDIITNRVWMDYLNHETGMGSHENQRGTTESSNSDHQPPAEDS